MRHIVSTGEVYYIQQRKKSVGADAVWKDLKGPFKSPVCLNSEVLWLDQMNPHHEHRVTSRVA